GAGLMVLGTVSGAAFAVFSRPLFAKNTPRCVSSTAMSAGAAALCVSFVVATPARALPRLDGTGWLAILYIGLAGGALSFFLYAWALGRSAPTTIMILIPLNPIAALLVGSWWLGEPLGFGLFAGLVLVIIGIILVVGPADGRALLWALSGKHRK